MLHTSTTNTAHAHSVTDVCACMPNGSVSILRELTAVIQSSPFPTLIIQGTSLDIYSKYFPATNPDHVRPSVIVSTNHKL